MRKILPILVMICAWGVGRANVGDTTWVQAHNDVWLPNYGNYDTAVAFPDATKTYRKIYMIVTMGKYACPGNPTYCGDWDYTVHNYIMTKTGDTVELGRLITPYANASYVRFPWTWKERYTYDVTDFYPILRDSARMRVQYSGYTGGFTENIKFAFIEGTPARNVLGMDKLWRGYFTYGKASDPIDSHVVARSKTAPANTTAADLRLHITGHGSDGNYCGEFCKKYYQVMLNGSQIVQADIWRDDCGKNHLYPQSGTWIYERANWCPGDLVHPYIHNLPGITGGSSYSIDVDFQAYTDNGSAGYDVDGIVLYYGGYNHATDADLTDIVSPSNHEMHFRDNPVGAKATILVKNNGSNPITSMDIEYTVDNGNAGYYNWQGTIAPLQEMAITLPEAWDMRATLTNSNHTFTAKIAKVNGTDDEDSSNNRLTSYFVSAPQWPSKLIVTLNTNKGEFNGYSETKWKIVDANDNPWFVKENNAKQATYVDTVTLGPGSYRLIVEDAGCDGINWWANSSQAGTGSFSVKTTTSAIPLNLSGYFGGDFGCGFTQAFNVNWPTAISSVNNNLAGAGMSIFPNPAANSVHIAFAGLDKVDGTIKIMDAIGRVVLQQNCNTFSTEVNTAVLANGVYNIVYVGRNAEKFQARLVISK